jgi:hypothetical protein
LYVYELLHLALSEPKAPKLLVRAEQDRLLGACGANGQGHLWEYASRQPVSGIREIHIPKRANPYGRSRLARDAKLEIRFAKVTFMAHFLLSKPWPAAPRDAAGARAGILP